jgi:hypothetical protein
MRRRDGILAVEMEAAPLYAFGLARNKPVLCVAHVTNQLGCVEEDFEKGDDNGARDSLALVRSCSELCRVSVDLSRALPMSPDHQFSGAAPPELGDD